ncbi:HDIG domain-containing protein [Clostridia bacterium]|nr:HDIG domain-containing protein [Clostridia bacterium]
MGIFERRIKKESSKTRKKRKNQKKRHQLLKTRRARRRALFVVLYIVSLIIMGSGYLSRSQSIFEGYPSPTTITASNDVSYESEILTTQAKEDAIGSISPVMVVDQQALDSISEEIQAVFVDIMNLREDYKQKMDVTESESEVSLDYEILDLDQDTVDFVITTDTIEIEMIRDYAVGLVRKYMEAGVQFSGVEIARQNMLEEVMSSMLPMESKTLIVAILNNITLIETLHYDDAATSRRIEEVTEAVDPVIVNITQNEVLVEEGELVTPLLYEMITSTNTSIREETYLGLLSIAIMLAIMFGIIAWFLFHYRPEVPEHESYLSLLEILIVLGLLMNEIFARISMASGYESLFFYMTPVAAIGMLTTILLDNETGLMLSTIIALLLGVVADFHYEFALVAILSAYIGVFSVARVGHRGDLMKSSLYIGLTNTLSILAMGWFLNYSGKTLAIAIGIGLGGAFLSSVLAIGTLPYFETIFKITTPVKLLEFSDPNQPLLRRLLLEAPGTYHHSIVVSNLAEAAAEAVDADRLLARVGAFYHDIGKLKRPYFFIENQQGLDDNPHDKLSPRLSTLVITSHVKDGLELAEEYGLPPSLQQFIATHHGDSLVRYFYSKAQEVEGSDIKEEEFRYDGKRPVSKEAAIVMLADTVEASVRSLKNPSLGRVEGFVRKIIKEKFDDNQLSESKLTFRELEVIAKAFIRILSGIYHQRVEYPEKLAKEVERRQDQNESNIDESAK